MSENEYRKILEEKVAAVKSKSDLDKLLKEIISYKHDYGTIVIGIGQAMLATMNYLNNSSSGGITGFQASCLAWELIPKLTMMKPPMKLVDYNHMLYPQYGSKFEKTITPGIRDHLIKKAKSNIENSKPDSVHPNVFAHWQSVARGQIPFGYTVSDND